MAGEVAPLSETEGGRGGSLDVVGRTELGERRLVMLLSIFPVPTRGKRQIYRDRRPAMNMAR